MRKLNKFLVAILGFALILSSLTPSIFAAENKNSTIEISKKDAVYDKELNAYVIPFKKIDGKFIKVSTKDYLKDVNGIEKFETSHFEDKLLIPDRAYFEYWRYTPSSTSTVTGSTKKVTADISCTTSGGCSISKSVSVTVSATYSVSVTAEKDAIKANAGFSWTNSATDQSTYTFKLKKGEKGYIGFRPYLRKTTGTLKKYSNWDGLIYKKSAYAHSPKKTSSGEADGYYLFVFK